MFRAHLRLVTCLLLASFFWGCADTSVAITARTPLTDDQRVWCSAHPKLHAEAASVLQISFVADYIRSSSKADGSGIENLEPPFLAIPSGDSEPLTYQVRFNSQADSDKACQAAISRFD